MWEEATNEGMSKWVKAELHTTNGNQQTTTQPTPTTNNSSAAKQPSGSSEAMQIDPSLTSSTPFTQPQARSTVPPTRAKAFKARPIKNRKTTVSNTLAQINITSAPPSAIYPKSSISMELPARPNLLNELPGFIQQYVNTIYDVRADGHCGFRAVAACLGRGEEAFMEIRQETYREIQNRRDFYLIDPTMYNLEEIENSLIVTSRRPCEPSKWMSMPSMAGPMANAFETPVFFFSRRYSHTALPHFSRVNNNPPIIIALIESQSHFVVLQMKNPNVFPAATPLRNRNLPPTPEYSEWVNRYADMFQLVETIRSRNRSPTVVDLT